MEYEEIDRYRKRVLKAADDLSSKNIDARNTLLLGAIFSILCEVLKKQSRSR